jgi:hypothetical protein
LQQVLRGRGQCSLGLSSGGNYRPSKVKPAEYGQWSRAATRFDLCWAYALQKKLCSVCIRADCDLQKMIARAWAVRSWAITVECWSNTGSILVKYWVNPGQVLQWELGQFCSSSGVILVKKFEGYPSKGSGQGQQPDSIAAGCTRYSGSDAASGSDSMKLTHVEPPMEQSRQGFTRNVPSRSNPTGW